jgi:predicted ATP-dependent endonuclease of OLD family
MRLVSFEVHKFRNVIDSTEIRVDDVTCLVGKNEAGKSATMQALHALNPARPPQKLDLLDDYPRWLKKADEITGAITDVVPIRATFELDEAEMDQFEHAFGVQVLKSNRIKAFRTYAAPSTLAIEAEIDYAAFLGDFLKDTPDRVQKALGGEVSNTSELIEALRGLAANQGDEDAETDAIATDATEALTRLWAITGEEGRTLRAAVSARLRKLAPRTFYFSSYSQLGGRYSLQEVFEAVHGGSDDESVQAAADFLNLARVVPADIEAWDFEKSNAELESVSSLLTQRVKEHWHQNDHLKLRVSLETEQYTNPQGQPDVRRWLQFRVEDQRHDFSNRLDRRSTGFRWFISFLAAFLEFEKDSNLILLLDEPGLSLHARAQMDLLDAIKSKLAAGRQVIYSTHSPFMVRAQELNHARVVEDQGPEKGVSVSNDAGMVSDPDTLFPLEAALGYDIAQNLFIGRRNIIVEGVSDYIYLNTISGHLGTKGRAELPEDCRVIPAGGAANIPTFLALLGTALDVVVLIDGNTPDQRIKTSIATGRLKEARIVSISDHCAVEDADIEDLFEPQEYLTLYNATFGKSLKMSQVKGNGRIVKRIAAAEKGEFNHGVVSAYFLSHLEDSLTALSDATLDRFASVIEALTKALPGE